MSAARRWLRSPKGIFTLLLALCTAVAADGIGWRIVLPGLVAASGTAMLLDAPLLRWRQGRWVVPDGAMLTGWLVALILSPHEAWWIAGVTAALAIAAKHALHAGRAKVLNPAAAGLVLSFYVLHSGQSWWGALPERSLWWLLVLLAVGAFLTQRLHKSVAVLTFLGVWFSAATLASYVGDPVVVVELFRAPDLHAAIFFAAFMLTDPPTSPPKPADQVAFGALCAVVAFAAFALIGAAYFLLAGVLVANVWEGWRKHRRRLGRGRSASERHSVAVHDENQPVAGGVPVV